MKKITKAIYLALILLFLYLPIGTLMVLSFNGGKSMNAWKGFSLEWYKEMLQSQQIMEALGNTLQIALWASVIATVIGTMACIGLNALSEKKRSFYMAMNNIPLLNADIVTGISIMMSFLLFGISLSYGTVLFAHITFSIPYVILSVMPKFKQLNSNTYEAAVDLGATPLYAFWKVVLPDIMPGIVSGFLLSFTMSVDDFVITHFTRGAGINTLSTLIYSQVKVGIRPTLYALSTVIFVGVLLVLIIFNVVENRREKNYANNEYKVAKAMDIKKVGIALVIIAVMVTGVGKYAKSSDLNGEKGTVYIYNFGDYLDPDLLDEFREKTGYTAVLDTFDINEEMYPVIKNNTANYDVVAASDYMIDKMRKEGLLAEIDFTNVPNVENLMGNIRTFIDEFDPGMKYCVPHTWGTYGIIYNSKMVDKEDVKSWKALWNEKYEGEIVMVDAAREADMIAAKILGYSMNTTNEEELKEITELLKAQKPLLYTYANDYTRDLMIGESAVLGVCTSGDFFYAQEENEDLEYFVPEEGTEVWADCWAIPQNAKNKEGAEAWINFMLEEESAIKNYEWLYYAIPNIYLEEELDNEIHTPPEEVLARCETLKNLGSEVDDMYSKYWKEMKGE